MQVIFDIFEKVFFGPVVNLLVMILQGFQALGIPGALGFAVIILTIIVRLLVWPFMSSQLKTAKKMADLKPELDVLKSKHKGDKQAFAAAQMALYKERGINPAGGCLPTLIQIPVIIALYQTIFAFFSGAEGLTRINNALYVPAWHLNSVPDLNFFGISLAVKPSAFSETGFLILLIPVVTAFLQFLQSKMMAPKPIQGYPGDSKQETKEKQSTDEGMAAMQSQMAYFMPLMVGYFAFQFPVGLALYWNTFTILGIIQQYFVSGWGGLEGWINKIRTPKTFR